jgi:hypothetical protein
MQRSSLGVSGWCDEKDLKIRILGLASHLTLFSTHRFLSALA